MKNAVRHMQNESSKEKEKKAGSTIFVLNHIYVKGKEKWKICMKKNAASVYRRVNVLARGEGTQRTTTFIYLCSLN